MLVIFWIILSILIDLTSTTEEATYFKHHPDGKLIIPNENPFDWLAYLESRNDLTRESNTYPNALQHYETKGKHSKQNAFPNALPPLNTLPQQLEKLYTFINKLDELKIPKNQRTIVTYAVSGQTNPQQSIETLINNELLFNATITLDSRQAPKSISTNFYWIYTIGENNNLKDFISPNTWNSVVVDIPWPMSEALCFHRFIQLLQPYLMKNFGSMFFLSNNARGPFLFREEGKWLQEYRSLLFQPNHPIGLVGPMLQCETQGAFIKLHAFMIKTETMPFLMQRFLAIDRLGFWIGYTKKQPLFIAGTLHHHGYNISSYLYYKRVNLTYFDGLCLSTPESQKDARFHDPSKWCDITPDEVLFYEYGGELLRIPGMICETTLEIHRNYLQKNYEIVNNINTIPLKLPETIYSGLRYELYHQYEKEIARDYLVQKSLALSSSSSSSSSALASNNEIKRINKKLWSQPLDPNGNKVCLLVRTAKMHGTKHHNNGPAVESVTGGGIDDLAESLLRQTDPNWEAILFITDNRPFETMLLRMLQKYNDSRFSYFDVPAKYRPAYSPTDAAYTPTDYVLRQVLHKRLDCRWISATNADNIYGSKVIENVRQTMHVKNHDDDSGVPDMVFVPLDSRNIADQDHDFRKTRETWNEFCLGINSMLFMNALAYTMQPRPFVGKVDLAAVFFNREKWLKENIYFGNFTDKNRRRCKGCQDGYFTEYLVHTRLWSYKRLPIDGLKSIVFHGPSPTWCIASGNVWFDHPEVSKVRCYSQKTANAIRHVDVPPKYVFDWQYFDEQERLCLRFSQAGFQKYQLVKTNKGKLHQQWQLLTAPSPQSTSNDATMNPEGAPITALDFPPTKAEIGGGAALIN